MIVNIEEEYQGITTFHTDQPGEHIVIQGGMHGNEIWGYTAVDFFVEYFKYRLDELLKGKVTFIRANIDAINAGKRYIERDMNRIFIPEAGIADEIKSIAEYQRAKLIMNFLKNNNVAAYIDLHGMTSSCRPMVISFSKNNNDSDLVNKLPVDYWTHSWKEHVEGVACSFVEELGARALAIECGANDDPMSLVIALRSIRIILNHFGLTNMFVPRENIDTRSLKIVHAERVSDKNSFHYFNGQVGNFDEVSPGSLIAKDCRRLYVAPREIGGREVTDEYIVVFKASIESIIAGQEDAYFLALEEK